MGSSKVTIRFTVTIPEETRRELKIKEGDTLVFVKDNDRIYVTAEL